MSNSLYVACKADNFAFRKELHEKLRGLPLKDPVLDIRVEVESNDSINTGDITCYDIVSYDKETLLQCSVLVAFLEKYSAGTCMEILYAAENQIPVYVIDPSLEFRKDIWIAAHTTKFFDTIDEFVGFYLSKVKGEQKE